jgi:hypothetical protein
VFKRRGVLRQAHVLALRAALVDGATAPAAFAAWRRHVDFEAIDGPTFRIVPLILANVEGRVAEDPMLERMRGVYRRTWTANTMRLGQAEQAVGVLDDAGIATILLKGGAIVVRWIGDAGLREMSDVDVLVPRNRARDALAALVAAGWTGVAGDPRALGREDLDRDHGIGLRGPAGTELDLHWRALREGRACGEAEALWERSEAVALGGRRTRVLAPEDHLAHACAHGATWDADGRIDWAADAALILRGAERFDWDRLVGLAHAERLEIPIGTMLDVMAGTLGLAVPAAVPRRLLTRRPALTYRAEFRLRRREPHELGPVATAFVALQDHRRRNADLTARPLALGIPSRAREAWAVEGTPALARHAAFAALGAPAALRPRLLGGTRRRALASRELAVAGESPLHLGADGDGRGSLLAGWSFAEPHGRWTDGGEAVLAFALGDVARDDLMVRLGAESCVCEDHPRLTVDVWANDHHVASWAFAAGDAPRGALCCPVPARCLEDRETLELALAIQDPFSPLTTGRARDSRRLGLFVREVAVGAPPVADALGRALVLAAGSADERILWEGWSVPESSGCWTDGPRGSIRLRVPPFEGDGLCALLGGIRCGPGVDPGAVSVSASGTPLPARWDGEQGGAPSLAVTIPRRCMGADGSLALAVHAPGATGGAPGDPRRLGVHVATLALAPGQAVGADPASSNLVSA